MNISSIKKLTFYTLRKRYSGTKLGILWSVLIPAIQSIYYIFIFGFVFRLRYEIGSLSYLSWFLSGFSAWFFFSESIINSLTLFSSNASLIKNFKISKIDLIVSSIFTSLPYLFVFGFLAIIFNSNQIYSWSTIILSMLGYFLLFLITLNCNILFSLIGLIFPDSKHALPNLLQLFLFTTNAIIPEGTFPQPFSYLIEYNPLSIIFSTIRSGLGEELEEYLIIINLMLFIFFIFLTKFMIKRFNRLSTHISSSL